MQQFLKRAPPPRLPPDIARATNKATTHDVKTNFTAQQRPTAAPVAKVRAGLTPHRASHHTATSANQAAGMKNASGDQIVRYWKAVGWRKMAQITSTRIEGLTSLITVRQSKRVEAASKTGTMT